MSANGHPPPISASPNESTRTVQEFAASHASSRPGILGQALFAYALLLLAQDASWGGTLKDVPLLSLLPSITWSIALPLSVPAVVGVLGMCFLQRREKSLEEQNARRMLHRVVACYLAAILLERASPSLLDTPFSWRVYVYAVCLPFWALLGFRLAVDQILLRRFSRRLGRLAGGSAVLFTLGEWALGYEGLFGWNWWPVRLTILFGFGYYLHALLTTRGRQMISSAVGLVCVSTQILLPLHKPIVWSALWAALSVVVLLRSSSGRRVTRAISIAAAVGIVALLVYRSDQATGGGLLARYAEVFQRDWLHLEPGRTDVELAQAVRFAAGGRDLIWANVAPRFIASPLLGTGFMQVDEEWSVQIHNYFLDLLLGVGLLGALPVFVAIGWWLRKLWRATQRRGVPAAAVPLAAYAVGVGAYGLVGNFASFYAPGIITAVCFGASLRSVVRPPS